MGKFQGQVKPRGKMTAYAFFAQTCREEHKRKHPGETVILAEFSQKCDERWKTMNANERKRFEDMEARDKIRYDREITQYCPRDTKRKKKRDPDAPKRALSAFLFFCKAERPAIRKEDPSLSVGDIAKLLGKKWENFPDKHIYEEMTAKDKIRYEQDKEDYERRRLGLKPLNRPVEETGPSQSQPATSTQSHQHAANILNLSDHHTKESMVTQTVPSTVPHVTSAGMSNQRPQEAGHRQTYQ